MAILKNNFGVSRLDGEFSLGSRESMSSDEDELQRRSSVSESDDEDDDADSGAGSDDFDLSELGEIGAEFCQIGNQSCSLPFELYDLPNLGEVLTVDTWNDCLTEEERFGLAQFLPDMDQDTFMRTLKELFTGINFHFGSPLAKLFDMLKGGLCEPRVACYMQGLNFLKRHQHYHLLRNYQNSMVSNIMQIKDAWQKCKGYSIEERLRVLNIMTNQRSLMNEKKDYLGFASESSEREESGEGFWSKKLKDVKLGSKIGSHHAIYRSPTLDVPSRGRPIAMDLSKYGKKNPKGILKLAGSKVSSMKDVVSRFPSIQHGVEMKSRPYGSTLALPKQDRMPRYDSGITRYKRGYEVDEEGTYQMDLQGDRKSGRGTAVARVGLLKSGRKHELLKSDNDFVTDIYTGLHQHVKSDSRSYGRSRDVKIVKDRGLHSSLKGNQVDWSDGSRDNKAQEVAFNRPSVFDEWNIRGKKPKMVQGFKAAKNTVASDAKGRSYRTLPTQMNGSLLPAECKAKTSKGKIRGMSAQNVGENMEKLSMFVQSEETESDSSEDVDEEENINLLGNNTGYSKATLNRQHAVKAKSELHNANVVGKNKKDYAHSFDGFSYSSKNERGLGEQLQTPELKIHSSKGKQKGQTQSSSYRRDFASGVSEKGFASGSTKLSDDDRKETYRSGKNGQKPEEPGGRSHSSLSMSYTAERKQRGKVDNDYSLSQSKYMGDYFSEEDEDFQETHISVNDHGPNNKLGKKYQDAEGHIVDHHERLNMSLLGCNSIAKKRKGKANVSYKDGPDESDYLHSSPQQQTDDSTPLKKRGKRKAEVETGSLAITAMEPHVSEKGMADVEAEKALKKPFTLITPTVHTGFSFSIIHLLSAVRVAMITPNAEDVSGVGDQLEKSERRQRLNTGDLDREHEGADGVYSLENLDINGSDQIREKNLPSLTVQEIVYRVTSNPGDPCILETQEPLQDLVRGVLKIFSSKTAPLGAKGWKALAFYEKSNKSWSWIGPVTSSSSDHESVEEETSAAAWGLPYKMLVKLVDSFANWLKNGQETLQQIGSLPAPPVTLMQPYLDEKERFRDLRAQKSLTTISPSSEEVRAYFRKEEFLRYSVPDRAFSYTAADGRKSIVAPLRRCGGKPTSKARDHFMLKPDRPPHVTILCLVRDAAARLPGSIGTRADVCTLIRDSQYIVEDVSDAQINQVVSGALDRLHYERDPCVQFDGDRKLWVYLHREREEEDFEDDGTSSTKKWKRQRKEATDQSDQGTVSVAYHGTGEPIVGGSAAGYDLSSDLNVEPLSVHGEKMSELAYNDLQRNLDSNMESCLGPEQGRIHQEHQMGWEVLGLNHMQENKLLCQENSSNEDFGDETFSRERPVGLLSASLL